MAGENGSWAGVALQALRLNVRCVHDGSEKQFYGGSTTAGDSELITVVLLYSGNPGLGDNETETASS